MSLNSISNIAFGIDTPIVGTRFTSVGAGTTASTYTTQFHNSTGASNSFMVRDDGSIGISNTPVTDVRLSIKTAHALIGDTFATRMVNSSNTILFEVSDDLEIAFGRTTHSGSGYFIIENPTGQFRLDSSTYGFRVVDIIATSATDYSFVLGGQTSGIAGDMSTVYSASGNGCGIRIFSDNANNGAFLSLNKNAWGENVSLQLSSNGTTPGDTSQSNFNVILSNQQSLMIRTDPSKGIYYYDSNSKLSMGCMLNVAGVGRWGMGTNAPNASSVLDIASTTQGVLFPRMTTAQRDAISSPLEGLVIYNLSTHVLNFYNGAIWGAV